MESVRRTIIAACLLLGYASLLYAGDDAPWGTAGVLHIEYPPSKVLYDLTTADENELGRVLDRVGYLYRLYGSDPLDSSIVVVIHGAAIPFFAIDEFRKHQALMQRAQSLTVGSAIEFRMCSAAAKLLNYEAGDIHGFVKMVPMADAEIIRLQHEGYAYMR